MTRTILFRRIVGVVVAVALTLGAIAGPASARTFLLQLKWLAR